MICLMTYSIYIAYRYKTKIIFPIQVEHDKIRDAEGHRYRPKQYRHNNVLIVELSHLPFIMHEYSNSV